MALNCTSPAGTTAWGGWKEPARANPWPRAATPDRPEHLCRGSLQTDCRRLLEWVSDFTSDIFRKTFDHEGDCYNIFTSVCRGCTVGMVHILPLQRLNKRTTAAWHRFKYCKSAVFFVDGEDCWTGAVDSGQSDRHAVNNDGTRCNSGVSGLVDRYTFQIPGCLTSVDRRRWPAHPHQYDRYITFYCQRT